MAEVNFTRLPLEDALQPLEKKAFINLSGDSSSVQRAWAAFSGDPERLDLGDVFQALAHPDLFGNISEIKDKLKKLMGYRLADPLTFKTVALSPTQQLALTIIEPADHNPEAPVVVFATGFAHPAPLYVPHMLELAKTLRTKVVLFDEPGNGGSQSSSMVNQDDFYKALTTAITTEVPVGGKYLVGGHSLGSTPVYRLFQDIKNGETPVGKRTLMRAVVINPIPSRLTETSGNAAISRGFMVGGVASEVAHLFTGLKANSPSLFDNDLPEKVGGRATITREDVPISVPGLLKIFGSIDLNDPALEVGTDPRIAVVLSRGDHLMNWNTKTFEGRRGYHVIDGDHGACLTGVQPTFLCTEALVHAFAAPMNPRDRTLGTQEIYHHTNGMMRFGIQSGMRTPSTLATPEISAKYGLLSFGQGLGVYFGGGITGEFGYQFGKNARWVAAPLGQLYLGAESLRLPVDLKIGAQAGMDFLSPSEQPITEAFTAAIGINAARIIDIEAQARFSFTGQFQDVVAGLKLRLN